MINTKDKEMFFVFLKNHDIIIMWLI